MEVFGFFLLLGIISITFGLIGGLLSLIFLPFKRRLIRSDKLTKETGRKINIAFIAALGLFAVYQTYDAIYPSDSFYKNEFTSNTGIDFPKSGVIQKKNAWYPTMHGDYWSAAIAEFSPEDYETLHRIFTASDKFETDTTRQGIGATVDYRDLTSHIQKQDIERVYARKRGGWFKIAFLRDKKTIIFEKVSD
ncbi:hypothetical protein ACMA1I_16150 [Pontibacter sp. 13R65]|uniref:hypothetical protein n=1 Tax=Pontibacter sp. 13R65 TaxID=3127458 RepID=UPI00301BEE60